MAVNSHCPSAKWCPGPQRVIVLLPHILPNLISGWGEGGCNLPPSAKWCPGPQSRKNSRFFLVHDVLWLFITEISLVLQSKIVPLQALSVQIRQDNFFLILQPSKDLDVMVWCGYGRKPVLNRFYRAFKNTCNKACAMFFHPNTTSIWMRQKQFS